MARPTIQIDKNLVEQLAKLHCTYKEIASITGVSVDTLERRCADLIDKAMEQGKTSLRREQWRMALNGDRVMLIWLGKQYLGQSEKIETKNENSDKISFAPETVKDAIDIALQKEKERLKNAG